MICLQLLGGLVLGTRRVNKIRGWGFQGGGTDPERGGCSVWHARGGEI